MTWELLQLCTLVYLIGLVWLQRQRWRLVAYLWSAAGLSFLLIHLTTLAGWNQQIAELEAQHIRQIFGWFGVEITSFGAGTLLIPESTGWTGLSITEECSSLIEFSAFLGLILFYPRLPAEKRAFSIVIGAIGTYLINLLRIAVIVVLIAQFGKPAVIFAHAFAGRLVYFVGIVLLYWFLLTRPTLILIRRLIETTGQGVD